MILTERLFSKFFCGALILLFGSIAHGQQTDTTIEDLNLKGIEKTIYNEVTESVISLGVGMLNLASDFSPSFYSRHFTPTWRRITNSPVDSETLYLFDKRFVLSLNLTQFALFSPNYQIKFKFLKRVALYSRVDDCVLPCVFGGLH